MTYKRKTTQKRVKWIQKARSLRWRQQEEENEAEEAGARSIYDVYPSTPTLCPTQPPSTPTLCPVQPHSSKPPSPQPSTSSAPSTCTPPPFAPDTTPLPATEKTHLQLRKEILQAANTVTDSSSLAQNTLVTATLDQLDTLVDKMRCSVRFCRNLVSVF